MFRKDDAALREVVTEHLAAMISDGSYKAILDKYGLGANAVAHPMMNAARNESGAHPCGRLPRHFGDDGRASGSLAAMVCGGGDSRRTGCDRPRLRQRSDRMDLCQPLLTAKVILEGITNTMVMAVLAMASASFWGWSPQS